MFGTSVISDKKLLSQLKFCLSPFFPLSDKKRDLKTKQPEVDNINQ